MAIAVGGLLVMVLMNAWFVTRWHKSMQNVLELQTQAIVKLEDGLEQVTKDLHLLEIEVNES